MKEMKTKYKPQGARNNNRTILFFGLLFIALILLITCVSSVPLLGFHKQTQETPNQEVLLRKILTAIPTSHYSVSLPVILTNSGTVTALPAVQSQIWIVIKIKSLGYELNGQRYDIAVFRRVDSQDTVKAYCIDRGLDTPDLGTEYLLNTDRVFVPLRPQAVHPIQRFEMIR